MPISAVSQIIRQKITILTDNPLHTLTGLCFLGISAFGATVDGIASTSLAIIFLASLFFVGRWQLSWKELDYLQRWLVKCLAIFFFIGLISYIDVTDVDEYVKVMGRYLRFFLIISVYFFLVERNIKVYNYLLAGLIISGPVFLFYALRSIEVNGVSLPAQGDYHWILFGGIATLNALLMVVALLFGKAPLVLRAMLFVSIMCALYASLLSQSRGAWLAVPVCAVFLLVYAFRIKKIGKRTLAALLIIFPAIVMLSPHSQLIVDRVEEAVLEIKQFNNEERVVTSVGGRLALWSVAIDVWRENPVFGTGVGDFKSELVARQKRGIYSTTAVHGSTHNLSLQTLAETGIVGFLMSMMALLILPWLVFRRAAGDRMEVIRLSGQIMILAFAVFGLTTSWLLRAPLVAIYLAYLMALLSSIEVENKVS